MGNRRLPPRVPAEPRAQPPTRCHSQSRGARRESAKEHEAMKVKLNLNVETVKRAAIQHGEKVVFGLAAFMLLWFLWNTIKLEVLPAEKQPDPLRQLSEQARQ